MRRVLTLGVAWLAAAVVAAVVAWQGVGLVGDQVTDDRPATLSAAQIEGALGVPVAPVPGDATPGTATDAGPATPPTTTAPTPTTAPPPAPEQQAVVRPYSVTGGNAVLSFTPAGVTVALARPDPSYQVRSEPTDGNGWRIEFDGPAGRSRIEGWWDGGPQDRVEDAGASDDGGGSSGGGDDHGDDD